jgi:Asp/Glu/hydantoin racemase
VATTTPALAARIDALMTTQNPSQPYLGCFLTEEEPEALMADAQALDTALLGAIRRAAASGAEQVIIGGGPLGEAALRLASQSPVPLIHPILAAAQEALDRLG